MVTQKQVFSLCLTDESSIIVKNLGLTADADIDDVITAIENYVKGHIKVSRKQQFGESVDNYLVVLRDLVLGAFPFTDWIR